MESKKHFTKVKVNTLVNLLVNLYNKGVDFIDIVSVPDAPENTVGITFSKDYMMSDMRDAFDYIPDTVDETERISKDKRLTDDDISNLI